MDTRSLRTRQQLFGYLEIPLSRPWHVLVSALVVLATSVTASYVLPERFRSATLILVELDAMPEPLVRGVTAESETKRMQTIRQEILSRTRLERVIHEVNPHPEAMGQVPLSAIVERMRESITINLTYSCR